MANDEATPCTCMNTCIDSCGTYANATEIHPPRTGFSCEYWVYFMLNGPGAPPEFACTVSRVAAPPETLVELRNQLLRQFPPDVYPIPIP